VTSQSNGEETANAFTHGIGLVASLLAFPVLVGGAASRYDAWQVTGVVVFGTTLVALYAASTLYHATRHPKVKRRLRVVDHCAIYLLIAGTYTPFTLGVLRGAWGWTLLGVIWTLALSGVAFKTIGGFRFPRLSVAVYLAMGWACLVAIGPIVARVPPHGVAWLVAGGLLYSLGTVFYSATRLRYTHTVWHLFVLAGSGCHVLAVLWYAAG
jgi:hemolysin III